MNFNRDCTVFEAGGGGGRGQGAGGGGVFPYIGHIGMCRPYQIGFLHRVDLKRVYTWPILVWNWVWSVSTYLSFQFQMSKERKRNMQI